MAVDNTRWTESLPLVLLSIRSTLKADVQCTSAELVYGTTLRLPGELIAPESCEPHDADVHCYAQNLKRFMQRLKPTPTRTQCRRAQVDARLDDCTYVFVRCDAVRKPLQPPYDGPFKVVNRKEKFFVIDRGGRHDTVSVDRLKAAYIEGSLPSPCIQPAPPPDSSSQPDPVIDQPTKPSNPPDITCKTPVTRTGRRVNWPKRYAEFVH